MNEKQDVIVKFVHPDCEKCLEDEDAYEEIAEYFNMSRVKNIVLGKINWNANDFLHEGIVFNN